MIPAHTRALLLGATCVGLASFAACGGGGEDAEIEQTMEDAVAAFDDGDLEAFLAHWTDNGLMAEFEAPREAFPEFWEEAVTFSTPAEIREIKDIQVEGETATADVLLALGPSLERSRYSLVKEGEEWKIDDTEDLVVEIPDGAETVDVTLVEFAFEFEDSAFSEGVEAIHATNSGAQAHEVLLMAVDEGVTDVLATLEAAGEEGEPEGVTFLGFAEAEAGAETNLLLTNSLEAGRYALVCFFPDVNDPAQTPHAFKGMISEFTIE